MDEKGLTADLQYILTMECLGNRKKDVKERGQIPL